MASQKTDIAAPNQALEPGAGAQLRPETIAVNSRAPNVHASETRIASNDGDHEAHEQDADEDGVDEESNGGDDDDYDDGDDEEDDDDDLEPMLKYQRLCANLGDLLKLDRVSSAAVSDRFLTIGTQQGSVMIMDLSGNIVKRWIAHSSVVNSVCIDEGGEYVGSASDDGKVIIHSLYSSDVQTFGNRRPVKSVCLEPNYTRSTNRQFASGGLSESVVLNGKGWFGNRDTIIHSGEGPIALVSWRHLFIVWANVTGIKMYDTSCQQKFAYIASPDVSSKTASRCNIAWKDNLTLMMAWADNVKIAVIKDRSKLDVASGLPARYVEVVFQFSTDFMLAGIAPFGDDILLISYHGAQQAKSVKLGESQKSLPIEVHVLNTAGVEVANDVLSVAQYDQNKLHDYSLQYSPAEELTEAAYYIISPRDIVIARARDIGDHVDWLIEKKRFGEAFSAADDARRQRTGRFSETEVQSIGQSLLSSLFSKGLYKDAAAACPKVLKSNPELWTEWIFKFAEASQIAAIYPHVPVKDPQLPKAVYELILEYLVKNEPNVLPSAVKQWPVALYDANRIASVAEEALVVLRSENSPAAQGLLESLVSLYTSCRQWESAFWKRLALRDVDAIQSVVTYSLYKVIANKIVMLMEYDWDVTQAPGPLRDEINLSLGVDPDAISPQMLAIRRCTLGPAVQMLIQSLDTIKLDHIVQQLIPYARYLHVFLDALFQKDSREGVDYHNLQIELYAEYDYGRLGAFLKSSHSYSMKQAYNSCEARGLIPEMIYLLGKMGDNRKALNLIIRELNDINRAIEFAKEQNDQDLWEDLMKFCLNKPKFIVTLMENIGGYINPVRLIQKIPNGLNIPNLKSALIRIMADYGVQVSLREGCQQILMNDNSKLFSQKLDILCHGISIQDVNCAGCKEVFLESDVHAGDNAVIFECQHMFHHRCVGKTRLCPLCASDVTAGEL
ncbi:uncharacterized protein BJ171DRAFT_496668 [Polychytrium aggregatum]|uniref:uncharacterized protein n=1 Tax=Polychytrium aggregatum TaxID=110093 RepID=UPI0022FDCE7E|nr:uncharacterized protein BJ171DRAFT_496668 [Polychytrium aggregatum]KAI9206725.1 hypothetical protein BJ171DRAFT_496668 [Polychytrium aggregatum]